MTVLWLSLGIRAIDLLCALRFNLNIDRNRLAYAGDGFSGRSKHQIEVTPHDWIGRHGPTGPSSFIEWCQQFHVKRDRLRNAVHC